jgi:hypothetical protein
LEFGAWSLVLVFWCFVYKSNVPTTADQWGMMKVYRLAVSMSIE